MSGYSYTSLVWRQFRKSKKGMIALAFLALFFLIGLYAPLFASSKPLLVIWDGKMYSPLLRYLFFPGFYTKPIDLFYNILMFTFPIGLAGVLVLKRRWRTPFLLFVATLHFAFFGWILSGNVKNPASNPELKRQRQEALRAKTTFREDPLLAPLTSQLTWESELKHMNAYEKLNLLLRASHREKQQQRLTAYAAAYEASTGREAPTLWTVEQRHETLLREKLHTILAQHEEAYYEKLDQLPQMMEMYRPYSHAYIMAKYELEHAPPEQFDEAQTHYQEILKKSSEARTPLTEVRALMESYRKAKGELAFLDAKALWFEKQQERLRVLVPPLIRDFHWEEDAGGVQTFNTFLPWWELTRVNRKDLVASLLFGVRVSLIVGATAVALSLLIGIPLGMVAGYFAGKTDIIICRFVEIWEAMPTFFMLLLVVAVTQNKSIFLVIAVLGIFGWTSFARFLRGEVLKQRTLPYVLACKGMGYREGRIMFSHILPNAIPPILTLLPFSMMAAITSEAGISFLGLGEEGSTSWGVLMDEGRSVFPAESYLLWPPAILLTMLLVSIALVGDALRDAIDPKMRD